MRPALLLVLLLLLPTEPGVLGEPGDALKLRGLDGGSFSEDELRQGTTILVIWASWSPRCRDIVPQVNRIHRQFADRARILTIVFQEDAAAVRTFLADQEALAAPVFLDESGAFSKKHAITTLPGLLVFKRGELTFRGKLPTSPAATIEQALQ